MAVAQRLPFSCAAGVYGVGAALLLRIILCETLEIRSESALPWEKAMLVPYFTLPSASLSSGATSGHVLFETTQHTFRRQFWVRWSKGMRQAPAARPLHLGGVVAMGRGPTMGLLGTLQKGADGAGKRSQRCAPKSRPPLLRQKLILKWREMARAIHPQRRLSSLSLFLQDASNDWTDNHPLPTAWL